MIYLFVHQNFPAQYRHVVRHLADQPGNSVLYITRENQNQMVGVTKLTYEVAAGSGGAHHFAVDVDNAVRYGTEVMAVCKALKERGIRPDVIIGHTGWGEMLFIKDIFPDVPMLGYFEFFYHPRGVDVGFDPEFARETELDGPRLRMRNAVNLISAGACDCGHTPTRWQRSLYPAGLQSRIVTLHEGVDTDLVKPDPDAWLNLARQSLRLTRADEVVTFIARNLEPYRGFHIFMRALPELMRRRPRAHVILVGGNEVSYGYAAPGGQGWRGYMMREVGAAIDLERVHFLGQIPHSAYLNVLQVSSVHVYLTLPFVLSWSCVEAMAAGAVVIASRTPPVEEVIRDGENGLMVDFHAKDDLVDRIEAVLTDRDRYAPLGVAARATAVAEFDLKTQTMPRWLGLIEDVAEGRIPVDLPPEPGPGTRLTTDWAPRR